MLFTGLEQGLKPHRNSGFFYPEKHKIFCEPLETLWSNETALEGDYIVLFEFALENTFISVSYTVVPSNEQGAFYYPLKTRPTFLSCSVH